MKLINIIFALFLITGTVKSQDYGLWEQVKFPVSGIQWTMIDFVDSLNGIVAADSGYFMITSDAGKTWHLDTLKVLGSIGSVRYLAPGVFWVVNKTGPDRVSVSRTCYRTLDGGVSWIQRTIPDSFHTNFPEQVSFIDTNTIFCTGGRYFDSNYFYGSTNSGSSWTVKNLSGFPLYASSLDFTDSLHGSITFAAGGGGGIAFKGYILTTKNGGKSWDSSGTSDHILVHYYTPSSGYAIGVGGSDEFVFPSYRLTTNGGASWTYGGSSYIFGGIKYGSGNILVFDKNTYVHSEADSQFSIKNGNIIASDIPITAFETTSERDAWLLTSGGRLFHRVDKTTGVKEIYSELQTSNETDISGFPNSFHGRTTIQYRLPSSGNVRIDVYDMLGRKVSTIVDNNEAKGIHEIPWDASHLSAGVYLCRLSFERTNKIVKLILR
ncbi:MAG: T9SS type A sorting domain-containing protein [Bacteroidota bacterium]